jgi:hypothetical protein
MSALFYSAPRAEQIRRGQIALLLVSAYNLQFFLGAHSEGAYAPVVVKKTRDICSYAPALYTPLPFA